MHPVLRFIFGSRTDWRLDHAPRPRISPSMSWLGPILIVASLIVSWPAFAGARGEGAVALGFWLGAVSILLMSWSFILALRLKLLEPLFGGLDSMYRVHRWTGATAVAFMYLHTSFKPDIDGGVRGAAKSVADTAEGLAGFGQQMLYVLVGVSLLRTVPYRYWRWSHKLLGIPFAFASWHFFTATKPYANGSAWGIWFGAWMIAGLAAFLVRVVVRDAVTRGFSYEVVAVDHGVNSSRIELKPRGKPLEHKLGQFAFLKLGADGLNEPHAFTIASGPERTNLEFFIRHLGDWSDRIGASDLVGAPAKIEGPYGRFEPIGVHDQPLLWIAGGVGITPFLAALDGGELNEGIPPTLLYASRDSDDEPMLGRVLLAQREGRVVLHRFSGESGRIVPSTLDDLFPGGLTGHHVALCGPSGLVSTMASAAAQRDASSIETEDFDIRQGFGPERSREIARALVLVRSKRDLQGT